MREKRKKMKNMEKNRQKKTKLFIKNEENFNEFRCIYSSGSSQVHLTDCLNHLNIYLYTEITFCGILYYYLSYAYVFNFLSNFS